jgi:hypothetical protein
MRFYDDPLAPVSAQFPLTRPGLAKVDNTETPPHRTRDRSACGMCA